MTTTLDENGSSSKLFALAIAVIVIGGIAGIVFFASSRTSNSQTADSISIDGEGLAQYPRGTGQVDPEIGKVFPTLTGVGFEGEEIKIEPDGREKAIYFLAHWCPQCDAEVPEIQGLIDAGSVPENMDIYAITTLTYDPNNTGVPGRGPSNYPPEVWLDKYDWKPKVMMDTAEAEAFDAAGGTGTPFVVVLDGENKVVQRISGRIPPARTIAIWNSAAAGAPDVIDIPEVPVAGDEGALDTLDGEDTPTEESETEESETEAEEESEE